ncbi:13528_t:CDS:10 [Entrophospora sp. SA101]|nr:3042_t:CDS:10 [Entrophospora sp. SA101]CAJ0764554.1 13528_t:CDS:10 [Entrophospora sp. SA101]CAJ0836586.1 3809_t:CDS:10 [Entrophospora sp. SA101]
MDNDKFKLAVKLISFLEQIGYPNASSLLPEQILWAFDQSEAYSLFEWLCENIDVEQNVIYNELRTINQQNLEKLRKENENIENDINNMKKTHERVTIQKEQLGKTLEDLEKELVELNKINDELYIENKKVDEMIEKESVKLDVNTVNMIDSAKDIISERPGKSNKGKYIDELKEIIDADQTLSQELEQIRRSIFSLNVGTTTPDNNDNYYLTDEINHLRNSIVKEEHKNYVAIAEFEYMKKYLQALESEYMNLNSLQFDPNILDSVIEENANKKIMIEQQYKKLLYSEIEEKLNILAKKEIEEPILKAGYKNQSDNQCLLIEKLNWSLMSASDFIEPRLEKRILESNDTMLMSIKKLVNLGDDDDPDNQTTLINNLKEKIVKIEDIRNDEFLRIEEESKAQQNLVKSWLIY